MNSQLLVYGGIAVGSVLLVALVVMLIVVRHRRPRQLDTVKYKAKWNALQSMLPDSKMWPLAIIDADKLLEDALKAKKYKGKTMGERLVSAQHDIVSNDAVWFAHKLRNRLVHDQDVKLRKGDVKNALLGFRAALKDIGALK